MKREVKNNRKKINTNFSKAKLKKMSLVQLKYTFQSAIPLKDLKCGHPNNVENVKNKLYSFTPYTGNTKANEKNMFFYRTKECRQILSNMNAIPLNAILHKTF